MQSRRAVVFLTILASTSLGAGLLVAGGSPVALGRPAEPGSSFVPKGAGKPVEVVVEAGDLGAALPLQRIEAPAAPLQAGCERGGRLARIVPGEGFEQSPFPRPGTRFSVSDVFSPSPGFLDEIAWGAVSCESSVGNRSLWSVGGGSIGRTLKCDTDPKQYPTAMRNGNGIRTFLRYGTVDLSVSNAKGIRITFDYMAKMPAQALFVGIGDGHERENEGRITYRGYQEIFQADTGGEWVRGEIVAYQNGSEFLTPVAGFPEKDRVEIAFIYSDPPNVGQAGKQGVGPPTPGMWGVFIDNLHIDTLTDARPCPIGSPTATEPIWTNTPEISETPEIVDTVPPTRTKKPPVIIPTIGTPKERRNFLPFLSRAYDQIKEYVVPTRAPSATQTPIPSRTPTATATETEEPTWTVPPTRTKPPTAPPTPTRTVRPTSTLVPFGQTIIAEARPFTPGSQLEIITLLNVGTGAQDLTGWQLQGASRSGDRCYLPAGLILGSEKAYEIRSGRDARAGIRASEGYGDVDGMVCNASFIWDNNFDQATLFDGDLQPMSRFCWDLDGPYPCGL